ncbi:LEA domain-containing protein [Colletotrichum truncatum]|uniref:LEA domain-containing protein n=1 Tax=Colletotrichum truncatum TaxID=5467 RepID=A0ACC3YQ81_COLTU|nr:LEA domain-containing protein [Colletotrichum truncatum]KAF6796726.1 LEA domain-containing protein [Colletotrichum truncatum]
MTASPPTRSTPPLTQQERPESPASTHPTSRTMQRAVPEPPKSSPHTMSRTEPRPVHGVDDPDHTSRHDEYEVVEAEDDEAGVEEAPRRHVRPPLPRLNSSSRAPPSPAPRADASPPQQTPSRSSNTNTPQPQKGGPFHLQGSREIPIPMRPASTHAQSAPNAAATPSSADTANSRTDEGSQPSQESQNTSAGSPRSQSKDSSGGKNAPIHIPKVTPIASGLTIPPNLAELAQGLEGKYVDEFGNILDWNGQVLGRVEGDLPSMIGRPVSVTGEIFSEDGEVVGYVAENDTIPPAPPSPKPIEGMGDGLKVDHMGNILDRNNNVIGHFDGAHLANSLQKTGQSGNNNSGQSSGARPTNSNPQANQNCSCGRPKPSSAPSPSEVFLDVKSTNDGIQLIIKIPTVFNGGGNPNIHIGTG